MARVPMSKRSSPLSPALAVEEEVEAEVGAEVGAEELVLRSVLDQSEGMGRLPRLPPR